MESIKTSASVIRGDIFQFKSGLLVIPRSTSGTLNATFERGLTDLGIRHSLQESRMGEVELIRHPSPRYPDLHVAFATSVNDNSSDYATIANIGSALSQLPTNLNLKSVYCPLLGTGAGGLDPFFAFLYLVLPSLRKALSYELHIVVYDEHHMEDIVPAGQLNAYSLTKLSIQRIFDSLRRDASIVEVMQSKEFFFRLAQDAVIGLKTFKISGRVKRILLRSFNSFKGNFQEFIDKQSDTNIRLYLLLIGEIITYFDSKSYNKRQWNKYADKRSIARAVLHQNDWVTCLITYSIDQNELQLSKDFKNAIKYIFNPTFEIPVLPEGQRKRIMETILCRDYDDTNFSAALGEYFDSLPGPRPINDMNRGVLIIRILDSPLAKLLWQSEAKNERPRKSPINLSQLIENELSKSADIPPENNVLKDQESQATNMGPTGKTYKARLHDDRHAEDDLLDHELYAQTIVNFIKHEDTQPPLTIGIFAPWGMGKTTLMKFIAKRFDASTNKPGNTIVEEAGKALKMKFRELLNKAKAFLRLPAQQDPPEKYLTVQELLEELKKPLYSKPNQAHYQYPTIWFNAWKYDNTEQILSGLAYEIITQLVDKLPNQLERERFYVNLNRKRFNHKKMADDVRNRLHAALLNKVSSILLILALASIPLIFFFISKTFWFWGLAGFGLPGIVNSVRKWVKEKKADAAKYFSSFVTQPTYHEKLGYFHEVETDMRNVFDCMVDAQNPCVIFIDDLDRCSSKKVVEVIEAINLFITGDFPNCYFIIGMDAQMVAASIEAAYSDIDKRSASIHKTHGSLGWYFLEKFVQLQFIIPNLSDQAGRTLLRKLFESNGHQADESKIDELKSRAQMVDVTQKESLHDLAVQLESVGEEHKDKVMSIKAVLIDRAAKEFVDSEKEAAALLENYAQYLNVSPRVIKRFANLFRFYKFMQMASLASRISELEDSEIAQMVIISLRWPQLPRLIQWNTESEFIQGVTGLDRAAYLDKKFEKGWKPKPNGETIRWLLDDNLKNFLNKHNIKLARYVEVGVW